MPRDVRSTDMGCWFFARCMHLQAVGQRVIVRGLQSSPQHNGALGQVAGYKPKTKRYVVHLLPSPSTTPPTTGGDTVMDPERASKRGGATGDKGCGTVVLAVRATNLEQPSGPCSKEHLQDLYSLSLKQHLGLLRRRFR